MEFTDLGLNLSILAAIVGMSELIKNQIDKENKFKKFYVLLPFFLSGIACLFITEPLQWQEYFKNVFIYTGISSYGYDVIKSTLIKKAE